MIAPRIAAAAICLATLVSPARAGEMARDQIFFAGSDPEPLLLAIILQRTETKLGAVAEAKVFIASGDSWRQPFWEQAELPFWPGQNLDAALDAWQAVRKGRALRLRWAGGESTFELDLQTGGGRISLRATELADAGAGTDPHGPVIWRAGAGSVTINGALVRGTVLLEALPRAEEPWPRFGRFEMWLIGGAGGGLILGRHYAGQKTGRAIAVAAGGKVSRMPFGAEVLSSRADPSTGFQLPSRWRLATTGKPTLERRAGDVGRGTAPSGGPAVFDISLATTAGGKTRALVFHLQDGEAAPAR